MELYEIISLLCIIALFILVLVLFVSFIIKNREGKITFIRQFKKGKCSIVYFISIPLYLGAYLNNGQNFLTGLFNAINKSTMLVVLRYDISSVEPLMKTSPIFAFAMYLTFALVTINAIMFAISFLHQRIWVFIKQLGWFLSRKEKLLVIGSSSENINIYQSEKTRKCMLLGSFDKKDLDKLYRKNIAYIDEKDAFKICDRILSLCAKNKKENYLVVINTRSDDKNIKLCNKIVKKYKDIIFNKDNPYSKAQIVDFFSRLRIYVFGEENYESVYLDIVNSSYGSINYLDKYEEIASAFIKNHPFSKYMNENHIDYNSALIKENVNINAIMLGFGKTNKKIFLTSVANNQFVHKDELEEIVLKPVNYYVFDKINPENDKNLNHNYYRYKNEFNNVNKEKYLPLPSLPANEKYFTLDINSNLFYKELILCLNKEISDINFVLVDIGTDLENIDLATKLLNKKAEWDIKNLILFVKVNSGTPYSLIFNRDDCFMYGNEEEDVYNIKEIDENEMLSLAKKRNEIYALEYELTNNKDIKSITKEEIDEIFLNANYSWHVKYSQAERESNMYACLSLRSKLNLLGLDFVKGGSTSVNEEEFMEIYAKNDVPSYSNKLAKNKKIIAYPLDFKASTRKNLAIQEHYRWNSFMISQGFVPSSIDEILNESVIINNKEKHTNGKNYAYRRHGNLTNFEGLIKFRKLLSERDNVSELEKDVIKYDYQLLDDAYWLLTDSKYNIIKR